MTHHENSYPFKNLAPKRHGPYKIEKVLSRLVYKLRLPKTMKIHPVVHASLLSAYHETAQHGKNFLAPPPDLIDGHEEYEVEAILANRPWGNGRRYLIR